MMRALSLALCLVAAPALAADDAEHWLKRLHEAAHKLDYDGTFVYQRSGQVDTLRITHQVTARGERERLVTLSGPAREIVRDELGIRCYLSDSGQPSIVSETEAGTRFPSLLPARTRELAQHYRFQLGKSDRVAGHRTRIILIEPRDAFRYGYRLWADERTGLLLRASLLNESGQPMEEVMFTQVAIGGRIPDSAVRPGTPEPASKTVVAGKTDATGPVATVSDPPPGFTLLSRHARLQADGKLPMTQLVYSDGLSSVSVFVGKSGSPQTAATSRLGAMHVRHAVVGDHQVTVLGDVPAATVERMAASVTITKP
jgi:sigma-E factor negative regulatory protein RseB